MMILIYCVPQNLSSEEQWQLCSDQDACFKKARAPGLYTHLLGDHLRLRCVSWLLIFVFIPCIILLITFLL